ncbi:hypothetical protein [Pararhizobium sp. DWP1-1-3]|uniref:hypothetical protein n=1 Tax=Pararhizobium sp. DWP1-1-3 TaxID=2804652 RepID=UPI003CEB476D
MRLGVVKICNFMGKQMYAKNGTDAYRAELIFAHYGIDVETLQVRSVWQRRDGMLWMGSYGHLVMPGRRMETELLLVFGLSDVRTVAASSVAAVGDHIRSELEELAGQRRLERNGLSRR